MMIGDSIRFPGFLAVQEENLLASIMNFRDGLDLFARLDGLYRGLPKIDSGDVKGDFALGLLYYRTHFHYYFGASCFLRCHLSEALATTRIAIDAALSAYRIALEPARGGAFLERSDYFQHIKRNIKKEIRDDGSMYPLAHGLIKLHETCSEFGSHADASSFAHRVDFAEEEGGWQAVRFQYFQFPSDPIRHGRDLTVFLEAFFQMYLIFRRAQEGTQPIIAPRQLQDIEEVKKGLHALKARYASSPSE